jgi:hypothetical protein
MQFGSWIASGTSHFDYLTPVRPILRSPVNLRVGVYSLFLAEEKIAEPVFILRPLLGTELSAKRLGLAGPEHGGRNPPDRREQVKRLKDLELENTRLALQPAELPAPPIIREHRPAAASQRSLQACIASLPLQSSLMTKAPLILPFSSGGFHRLWGR